MFAVFFTFTKICLLAVCIVRSVKKFCVSRISPVTRTLHLFTYLQCVQLRSETMESVQLISENVDSVQRIFETINSVDLLSEYVNSATGLPLDPPLLWVK